jgi:hypothetical protein
MEKAGAPGYKRRFREANCRNRNNVRQNKIVMLKSSSTVRSLDALAIDMPTPLISAT